MILVTILFFHFFTTTAIIYDYDTRIEKLEKQNQQLMEDTKVNQDSSD